MTIRSLKSSSSIRSVSNALSASAPTVPAAPTIGIVTSSGTSATVPFTASTRNGGSPIVTYTAVSSPGNISATVVQSGSGTITVTGLSASTSYTFTVYATNSVGNSANSDSSNSITTSGASEPNLGLTATGGTIYIDKTDTVSYKIHAFTTSGQFSVTQLGSSYNSIEILIVGGGGGAIYNTFGGGGGQVKFYGNASAASFTPNGGAFTITSTGNYTVTVGGGASGSSGAVATVQRGANTSFVGTGINISALGAQQANTAGGGYPSGWQTWGTLSTNPSGTNFRGAKTQSGGAGTGGASNGSGGNASEGNYPGNGGPAEIVTFGIDALPKSYGGGGAGGVASGNYGYGTAKFYAQGATGSGGDSAQDGIQNSGGGGGGIQGSTTLRNGASGIVVVRYRTY